MALESIEQEERALVVPGRLRWIRIAVGMAAGGYWAVSMVDLITSETSTTNQGLQLAVALVATVSLLVAGRWPRVAGGVVAVVVWLQLVLALCISSEPVPALLVFPVLAATSAILLGQEAATWLGALSSVAIPAAMLVGKARLTGRLAISGQELDWLLAAEVCTVGLALIIRSVLASHARLLRATEQARRRYLEIFEQTPDGLVELDAEGLVTEANRQARGLLGAEQRDPVGRPIAEVLSGPGGGAAPDMSRAHPAFPLVVEIERPGGGPRTLEITASEEGPRSGGRRLIGIRDVTERRALEERLGHAQRLETVGQLACGVAHELGNLLTVIGANAAVLVASGDQSIRESGRDIQEAQLRGNALTRQLLAFGRQDRRRPERLDMVAVVRDIARLLDRLLGGSHRLALAGERPLTVLADRRQLEQVAMNLVTNARDAMPLGGEIRIRVLGVEHGVAQELGSELDAPEQAMLEVEDHGLGMSAELQARIFQPFFTTKPPGKGTGLGLSTVKEIVGQAGGRMAVDSAPGRGSRFRLFLPIVED